MPLCSAFSKTLVVPTPGTTLPPPPTADKNWNPGNYIASTTTNNDSIWNKAGDTKTRGIIQRLQADTAGHWKGALLRFNWPDLEGPTLGSYTAGFDKVDSYLDQMAAYPGRRLIIMIPLKTFGSTVHAVPQYMRDSTTYADPDGNGNGEYSYDSAIGGPGGYVPNIHVVAVRQRYEALMNAFAARFNTNPYLEAVVMNEASISRPSGVSAPWSRNDAWFTQMETALTNVRPAFSNIQFCQWINAERADMKTYVPNIRPLNIGFGMPDLCPLDQGFNFRNDITGYSTTPPGNIQHCQNSNGMAIIIGHASKPALEGTVVQRTQTEGDIQGQPTVYPTYPGLGTSRQAVRDFAVNTVGVTHLCWAHNTGEQPLTGERDPRAPGTANAYTAYGNYGGRGYNAVTDEWIHDAGSTITTVATRPTGW